jgi:sugar phosphate isomerase/epimerase
MKSENLVWNRRDFLKVGGTSTAALGVAATAALPIEAAQAPAAQAGTPPDTPYPKLSIITPYSPQKLAFAAQAGYEGVVVTPGPDFNPNLSDSAIDQILATARNAGIRIVSIEYFAPNHTDPDAGKRSAAQAEFIRALEFCHRLGCKFVGTFSGGQPGASIEDQAAAFADVFNEKYLPVCEKLDVAMGWENYPTGVNFASTPAAMQAVFDRVASHRLGLEFDPSHFVRLFIDPVSAAWQFKDRILAVHAKDTEITQPVLQQVGIAGKGWWRYRIPGQGHCELDGVPHGAAPDPLQWRHRGGARRPILGSARQRQPSRFSPAAQRRIHPGAAFSGTVSAGASGINLSAPALRDRDRFHRLSRGAGRRQSFLVFAKASVSNNLCGINANVRFSAAAYPANVRWEAAELTPGMLAWGFAIF